MAPKKVPQPPTIFSEAVLAEGEAGKPVAIGKDGKEYTKITELVLLRSFPLERETHYSYALKHEWLAYQARNKLMLKQIVRANDLLSKADKNGLILDFCREHPAGVLRGNPTQYTYYESWGRKGPQTVQAALAKYESLTSANALATGISLGIKLGSLLAKTRICATSGGGAQGRNPKAPALDELIRKLFASGVTTTAPALKRVAKKELHGLKLSGGFLCLTDKQGKLVHGGSLSWETVKDRLKVLRREARRETGEK